MNIAKSTKNMVANALLCGITVLLGFTPLGMIPLPIVNATTTHLPVLIATLYLGHKNGLVVATCFGLVSFIRALQQPIGLAIFFVNPLIAILPGLSIPLIAFAVYKLSKKLTKTTPAFVLASFFGSLANTVFTLGSIYIFYGTKLTEIINNSIAAGSGNPAYYNNASLYLLSGVAIPYGLTEALVAALIVPTICITLRKAIGREEL